MSGRLRLAVLLNRGRAPHDPVPARLEPSKSGVTLTLPADWVEAHPLTKGDLHDVEWVVRKAEELDFYCDFGNLSDHYLAGDRLDPLYPDKDDHRRTVDWLLEEKKRNRHIGASVATLEFVRDTYRLNGTYEKFPRCYSGKLFCYIDTHGDCVPPLIRFFRRRMRITR